MSKEKQQTEQNVVAKISDLHLAKLQESNSKFEKINNQAAEIYQREFELKNDKVVLDNYNAETLQERQKINNELFEAYGKVQINPMTGEYQTME